MGECRLQFWAFLYTELLLLCWSVIGQQAGLVGVGCWGKRAILMERLSIGDRCDEERCLVKCTEQKLARREREKEM
jgi:hypothetical protein